MPPRAPRRRGRSAPAGSGALAILAAAAAVTVLAAATAIASAAYGGAQAAWAVAPRRREGRAAEVRRPTGSAVARHATSVVDAEEVNPSSQQQDAITGKTAQVMPGVGEEKVAIITGASTGIGLATAEGMAQSGRYRRIIFAGRDRSKHECAIADLKMRLSGAPGDVILDYEPLDLASLKSVRQFAENFLASGSALDTLVLNAGVMALPRREMTEDGFEYQFGVNHLGHFLLANLLMDTLVRSGSASDPSRVISLSSMAHQIPSNLLKGDLGDLQSTNYNAWTAYGQSKLANVLFVYQLDRLCRERGLPVAANAVHPGGVDTELARHIAGGAGDIGKQLQALAKPYLPYVIKTPEDGAKTSILLATGSEGKLSGRYWQDERPAATIDVDPTGEMPGPMRDLIPETVRPRFTSYDPAIWSQLWRVSSTLVGLRPGEAASLEE